MNLLRRVREKIRHFNLFASIRYRSDKVYTYLSEKYSSLFLKSFFIIENDDNLVNEIAFFKKNDFLVIKDFIDKKTVDFFINSLKEFKDEDFMNASDLARPKNIFFDRVIKNSDFLYLFPEELFKQYNHVRDAHNLINKAPIDLFNMVIKKSEYLFNSKVSIEVSEIYETIVNGDKTKVNSIWHNDAIDIYKSIKVIIYLNDVGLKDGALKVKSKINHEEIEFLGSAGTAIFFRASELVHSGSMPEKKSRWCINFKVYPKITTSVVVKGGKPLNFLRRRHLFRAV